MITVNCTIAIIQGVSEFERKIDFFFTFPPVNQGYIEITFAVTHFLALPL
jgi:hypothetical protein